jgi:hypothetical protein
MSAHRNLIDDNTSWLPRWQPGRIVTLSAAKHLAVQRARPYAALSVTTEEHCHVERSEAYCQHRQPGNLYLYSCEKNTLFTSV